jgi:hypothetical protein
MEVWCSKQPAFYLIDKAEVQAFLRSGFEPFIDDGQEQHDGGGGRGSSGSSSGEGRAMDTLPPSLITSGPVRLASRLLRASFSRLPTQGVGRKVRLGSGERGGGWSGRRSSDGSGCRNSTDDVIDDLTRGPQHGGGLSMAQLEELLRRCFPFFLGTVEQPSLCLKAYVPSTSMDSNDILFMR